MPREKACCTCPEWDRRIQRPLKCNTRFSSGLLRLNERWHIDVAIPMTAESIQSVVGRLGLVPLKRFEGKGVKRKIRPFPCRYDESLPVAKSVSQFHEAIGA